MCKALYPAIHALEVALRNNIHHAATNQYGTPYWIDQPDVLLEQQREKLAKARDDLTERNKPHSPDDIVALMLGFWVSLFNKPFEFPGPGAPVSRLSWHDAHNHPTDLFKATFPHAPNAVQSRKKILKRCNSILWLRNRVMHHETIWKYADLPRRHADILATVGWINPTIRQTIMFCDDFSVVHAGGKAGIESRIRSYLSSS